MRAKMMIMNGNTEASALSLLVQQMMTDLAVAFGHSFMIVEEKISKLSLDDYGSAMTEEAVEAACQCEGILCISPDQEGVFELAEGLACILQCHVYNLPSSVSGYSPLKSGKLPYGVLACPIVTEERDLQIAADHMFSLSKDSGLLISEIPYSGKRLELWEQATRPAAARYFLSQRHVTDLPTFLDRIIRKPDEMGVLLATPFACAGAHAAASALCGVESFVYNSFWDHQGPRMYLVHVSNVGTGDSTNPFGVLYAIADMMKYRLGLDRESDFLLTCCKNVLEAGWRTADIAEDGNMRVSTEAVFRLISEQIELVAALGAP